MPKKKNDTPSIETEKGFGTGLRVKLEGRRGEPADPVAETEAEASADETPEPTETEQLWTELEETLAREDELKQALAERAEADQKTVDLERTLAARAEALEERERKLEAELKTLQEEAKRLESKPKASRARASALAHLRKRADENAEQVWKVFQEALTATMPDGQPDFRTRLTAAATLLEETYGAAARQLTPGEQVEAARDELAGLRAARTAGNKR